MPRTNARVRERLLELADEHGRVSGAIARRDGIGHGSSCRCLLLMEKNGWVRTTGVRPHQGPGSPEHFYELTEAGKALLQAYRYRKRGL